MVVFKVLKNQLQQFITMQISMDSDEQKTNHFFIEYTVCDAQMFQSILISLIDSIKKAIAERGLYKRAHDNRKTKNTSDMFEKTKRDHKILKEENILLKKEIEVYKEKVRNFNEKQYISKLEQEKDKLQYQVLKAKNATNSVKKAFKQDEDKYVNNIIQLEAKNKDLEDTVCKIGKSSQTLRMLTNEQSLYRENKRKIGLGYTDPCPLGQAIAFHPKLYDAEVLGLHYVKPDVHDSEEILNDAKESQVKMKEKQFQFNYENINSLYDTFVPQTELSPESESSKEMSDLPIPKMPNEISLSKSSKELQQEITEEVQEMLDIVESMERKSYAEIKNKEEIEWFSKESKDGDKFCNDVVDVKEKLSKRIVQLEKYFSKLETQSITFEIALQHKTQENKSLKTVQKENEFFLSSLQIENAHLKQTYKDLFESVQSSRVESNQCDEVKIKLDVDEIATRNIQLEYQVASLLKENEHEENLRSKLSEFEDEKFDHILGKDDSFPRSIAESNISELEKESGENLCDNLKCELPTKNLCVELDKVLTKQTKDLNDVKLELSNRTAKFEANFEKLENTKVILERQLARKVDDA
ncbi:hypothetical protein Tco_0659119 [Tanacetum coccineum]